MKPNNPPAFPMQIIASPNSEIQEGMTLRDWFAGMATDGDIDAIMSMNSVRYTQGLPCFNRQSARYEHANKMLAEREKGQQ